MEDATKSFTLKDYVQSPGPHYFSSSYSKENLKKLMNNIFNDRKHRNQKGSKDGKGTMKFNYSKDQLISLDLIPAFELLDVNLAIRNLENSKKWKHLLTEALLFTLLMLLYVLYISFVRYLPELVPAESIIKEEIINKRTPLWTNVQESEPANWASNSTISRNITSQYFRPNCNHAAFIAPCNMTVCSIASNCDLETNNVASQPQNQNQILKYNNQLHSLSEKGMCIKSRKLITFQSVSTFTDFETWMDNFFIVSTIFGQSNGRAIMGGTNFVLGAVRLRQVRSSPQPCKNLSQIKNTTQIKRYQNVPCYGYYDINTQDMSPLVLTSFDGTKTTYEFRNASDVFDFSFRDRKSGRITTMNTGPPNPSIRGSYLISSYDHGGYVVDIPSGDRCNAANIWKKLKDQKFIDPIGKGTAALFISFTTYNSGMNGYVFTNLLIEFIPGDVVRTSSDIRTFRLDVLEQNPQSIYKPSVKSRDDFFTIGSLAMSLFFILYYLISLYKDSRYVNNRSDLFDGWRLLDFLQLSLMQASIWQIYNIRQSSFVLVENSNIIGDSTLVNNNISLSMVNTSTFLPFMDYFSYYGQLNLILVGTVIILSSVKYFKYLDLVPRFGVAWRTLEAVKRPLVGWIVVYWIFFLIFSLSAYLFFAPFTVSFRSVEDSMLTVFFFSAKSFLQSGLQRVVQLSSISDSASTLSPQLIALPLSFPKTSSVNKLAGYNLWMVLFIIVFHWVLLNLVYGMIILGYQVVFNKVEAEENEINQLRKTRNTKSVSQRANFRKNFSYLSYSSKMILKMRSFFLSYEYADVVLRLKTDEEIMKKGYLTKLELYKVVSEVIKSQTRVEEIVEYLMSSFSIKLNHIEESVLIYEKLRSLVSDYRDIPGYGVYDLRQSILDQENELESFEADIIDDHDAFNSSLLKLDETNDVKHDLLLQDMKSSSSENADDNKFDPAAEEKWIYGMLEGDVLLCMAIIQNMQSAKDVKKILKMMVLLDREETAIIQILNNLERQLANRNKSVEVEENPMDGVIQDNNNKNMFHVHHVSKNGKYRYVGKFNSYNEAEAAYTRVSIFVAKKEKEMKDKENQSNRFLTKISSRIWKGQTNSSEREASEIAASKSIIFNLEQEEGLRTNNTCLNWINHYFNKLSSLILGYEQYNDSYVCSLGTDGNWYDSSGNIIDEFTKPRAIPPRSE